MTPFTPEPQFPEEWWQDLDLSEVDPYTAMDEFDAAVGADTWVACALWTGEVSAPPSGYVPWFPTATDLVLWLRWVVLATSVSAVARDATRTKAGDVVLSGEAATVARIIDGAPDGTSAADVLGQLDEQQLRLAFGDWEVGTIRSIHAFLSEAGTVEQWRSALQSNAVDCTDGRWSMPEDVWLLIRDGVMSAGGECSFTLRDDDE
jgi:hypothetical protein